MLGVSNMLKLSRPLVYIDTHVWPMLGTDASSQPMGCPVCDIDILASEFYEFIPSVIPNVRTFRSENYMD